MGWIRRISALAVAGLVFAGCGGGDDSAEQAGTTTTTLPPRDDQAFASWYERVQDRREEILGPGTRYSIDDGFEGAEEVCALLADVEEGQPGAAAQATTDLGNSLSRRYFYDASVRWECPEYAPVVEDLLAAGAEDLRGYCAQHPDAFPTCGEDVDPFE